MPLLTENSFQKLSDDIVLVAEDLTLSLLERISRIAEQLIEDPDNRPQMERIASNVADEWGFYEDKATDWTDENLSEAYLKGIKKTNGEASGAGLSATAGAFASKALLSDAGGGGISDKAAEVLSKYPEHHSMYSVFQEQAYRDLRNTRVPVIRDVEDKVRRLTIEASESAYRDADTFTRRQMSQELMRRFADENITGIRYDDGRTMKLDSYSEMVARTQTGNAAREASMRRAQEYGLDLVQISVHYPCSDLCVDWQGRVYSISGESDRYPSLQTAISGGLYHVNCKHSQSAYIPGTSKLPDKDTSKTRNKEMYQAQQRQRSIERKIRAYKRRKATALTDDARKEAQSFISKWQGKQRELLDSNDFLRRRYDREGI